MISSSCDKGGEGCTDSNACNYNSDAITNNGSCLDNDCAGVTGPHPTSTAERPMHENGRL